MFSGLKLSGSGLAWLACNLKQGAEHLIGEAHKRDARLELRLRLRHFDESVRHGGIITTSDRFEQARACLPKAVKGAGEGHGGVGDRRHAEEYARGRLRARSESW